MYSPGRSGKRGEFLGSVVEKVLESALSRVMKRYEPVGGVRIEDVIITTNDGYQNLTSDIDWVEKVCYGRFDHNAVNPIAKSAY